MPCLKDMLRTYVQAILEWQTICCFHGNSFQRAFRPMLEFAHERSEVRKHCSPVLLKTASADLYIGQTLTFLLSQ